VDTYQNLMSRVTDLEDQFTERKLEGAGGSEFKKTIVAFANSLPANRTGVLFVGITDAGKMVGVENSDSLQRNIRRLAENECYPAIYVDMMALNVGGRIVVAVSVSPSTLKPHFAGAAYIRRGSESIAATPQLYE
jgi:predicted HTH transcriptional regulator